MSEIKVVKKRHQRKKMLPLSFSKKLLKDSLIDLRIKYLGLSFNREVYFKLDHVISKYLCRYSIANVLYEK